MFEVVGIYSARSFRIENHTNHPFRLCFWEVPTCRPQLVTPVDLQVPRLVQRQNSGRRTRGRTLPDEQLTNCELRLVDNDSRMSWLSLSREFQDHVALSGNGN